MANAEAFYLDYLNNYLTVARIAEDYSITEAEATKVIELGKKLNNNK